MVQLNDSDVRLLGLEMSRVQSCQTFQWVMRLEAATTVGGDQSLEELRPELDEAREQQAAAAEVLRAISSSPTDRRRTANGLSPICAPSPMIGRTSVGGDGGTGLLLDRF